MQRIMQTCGFIYLVYDVLLSNKLLNLVLTTTVLRPDQNVLPLTSDEKQSLLSIYLDALGHMIPDR